MKKLEIISGTKFGRLIVVNEETRVTNKSKSCHRNKFRAKIRVNKKDISLGTFDTPEKASEAYQKALRELQL